MAADRMIQEESLLYLSGLTTIYYAGFDCDSLPFRQGGRQASRTAEHQATYLKALSLVADHIVIPPSFYFYLINSLRDKKTLDVITEMYDAGIVSSPIYKSMNSCIDFIDYKMSSESVNDSKLITSSKQAVTDFFRRMPVHHRDVARQSIGFMDLFSENLKSNFPDVYRNHGLVDMVRRVDKEGIVLSRASIHGTLLHKHNSRRITTGLHNKLFYLTNACYYKQGAQTYDSYISLLGAEKYATFNKKTFSIAHGILIGYDPEVILGILAHLGIPVQIVESLSIQQIMTIRESVAFPEFRDAYRSFSCNIQDLMLQQMKLTRDNIGLIQKQLSEQATARYLQEAREHSQRMRPFDILSDLAMTAALLPVGGLGVKLLEYSLNLTPPALNALGVKARLADYVLERLDRTRLPFYYYLQLLLDVAYLLDEKRAYRETAF